MPCATASADVCTHGSLGSLSIRNYFDEGAGVATSVDMNNGLGNCKHRAAAERPCGRKVSRVAARVGTDGGCRETKRGLHAGRGCHNYRPDAPTTKGAITSRGQMLQRGHVQALGEVLVDAPLRVVVVRD